MKNSSFNSRERKLITGISLIMGIRMLGVSMIFPVFSIFATGLPNSTATLAGLAVGIFGIVQVLVQVPIGRLSDVWGRKQVTLLGLGVYFIGSILSGLSKSIHHLIFARLLSGAGAINGVTMACLADGVSDGKRNSALSFVGISMGLAVIVGFTLSPIVAAKIGIPYLFYICAAIILVTIFYTARYLDRGEGFMDETLDIKKESFLQLMKNGDLLRLNIIGFVGNISLASVFFIMPLLFHQEIGISHLWKLYIPVALLGTASMFCFGKLADLHGTVPVTATGLALELAGITVMILFPGIVACIASFVLFYTGHCILSPVLPAAVSRYPNARLKGTVMSIFNSFQFLGSGIGGLASGIITEYDHRYIFVVLAVLVAAALMSLMGYGNFSRNVRPPGACGSPDSAS